MNAKLKVTKTRLYHLIKDYAGMQCPDIKADELSKIRDCEFQKDVKHAYYRLNFSTDHMLYKAELDLFSGKGYLKIRNIGADIRNEWIIKIGLDELEERGMITYVPDMQGAMIS